MQAPDIKVLLEKWAPVLDNESVGKLTNYTKRKHCAIMLENMHREKVTNASVLNEAGPGNQTGGYPADGDGGIAKYDPVLISLVRRAMPKLIAYDVCGVQPTNMPTGVIFALRSRFVGQDSSNPEAFYNEFNSGFSGAGSQTGTNPAVLNDATPGAYTTGTGMSTAAGESLGDGSSFGKMAVTIEKMTLDVKTRALAADYSIELAQDMKAIHGLDAEAELTNILSQEVLGEMNREIIRTMYINSTIGAQIGTTTAGILDLSADTDGRWSVERYKGVLFQIEREANQIARDTRRGRGNFIICSSDLASALFMTGLLDNATALDTKNVEIDDAGVTFVGTLLGKYKVYIDPYIPSGAKQFLLVGYKGKSEYDAGIFYAPYVPLQMVRAQDPNTFQPKIGFKTRYGLIANPFAQGTTQGLGALTANTNLYMRKLQVTGL